MRLQIRRIAMAGMIAGLYASALSALAEEGRGAAWVSVFHTNDRLTVISPQAALKAPVLDIADIEAAVDVDIITAATVDVLAAASPRGYSETRHGYSAGGTYHAAEGVDIGLTYMPSFEPDYISHGAMANASVDFIDRRLTVDASYRFSIDSVGRTGSARPEWKGLSIHGASLTLAWVFDPWMVGQLSYEFQAQFGYMESPYRYVPLYYRGFPGPIAVSESVPDTRFRHALSADMRRALGAGFFGRSHLRLYIDSWDVLSHTEEIELQRAMLGSHLIVGIAGRIYGQGSASFYRYRYTSDQNIPSTIPKYRSADKMLSSQWTWLAGPRIEVSTGLTGPFSALRFTLKAEIYEQHFLNFPLLNERTALMLSGGAAGEY